MQGVTGFHQRLLDQLQVAIQVLVEFRESGCQLRLQSRVDAHPRRLPQSDEIHTHCIQLIVHPIHALPK